MSSIFAVVNDLFFAERLRGALHHLGHEAAVVDLSLEPLPQAVPPGAAVAIIDLEAGEPAIAAIRLARQGAVPVLAFGPHTDLALREAALAAGADRVVAKSKLTTSLPELIATASTPSPRRHQNMRIVIMGSGATGSYFGAKLIQAGCDVTFIARGAHLQALQTEGLKVIGLEEFHLPKVTATNDPATVGPVDVIIFAVKAYDTDEAARLIRPMVGPQTMVVPIQNGVDSAARIGAVVGMAHMVGGLCRISVDIPAPGAVRLNSNFQELFFGELNGAPSDRTATFAGALQRAGVTHKVSAEITVDIWKKFVFITAMSGITGATRSAIGPIRECPETFDLYRKLAAEVVAVGRAEGVDLPVDLADVLFEQAKGLAYGMKASLLVDLEKGKRLEVETLQGTVCRLGRKLGIPTPTMDVIYALIKMNQPR
jgi:2-dehydropantoate 2-reductase